MTEESGQRKVVGRKVAIALGLICIVLAAGLVGVLAIYLSGTTNTGEIDALKAENANLQGNLTAATTQLDSLASNYVQTSQALESAIANITELLNVVQLGESLIIVEPQVVQLQAGENQTLPLFNDFNSVSYAGYFTVQVTSNSSTTFAQVLYSYAAFNFNDVVVVGKDGTAAFAVLPTSDFTIKIGNTEPTTGVNATVTVTYIF